MFFLGYQNLLLALQEHYLFGKINTKKDYGFKFIMVAIVVIYLFA